MHAVVFYVIVRPDSDHPLLVYPDRKRAEDIARVNGYRLLMVEAVKDITKWKTVTPRP